MKVFFIVILLITCLFSCELYSDSITVRVGGLSKGKVVLSGLDRYDEIIVCKEQVLDIKFCKGEVLYLTFFPIKNKILSRYPLGAIVDSNQDYITISPHLGPLTTLCNNLNKWKTEPDVIRVYLLKEKFLECDDPWIYYSEDINLYLLDKISIGSISKFKKLELNELSYLFAWIPENILFNSWYQSVQLFYNPINGDTFRLEIHEDGSYCGFE